MESGARDRRRAGRGQGGDRGRDPGGEAGRSASGLTPRRRGPSGCPRSRSGLKRTIMSLSLSLIHASPVRRGRAALIALWSLQVALAGMFLLAGGSKLFGAQAMVALFNAVGIGQWFRYVTGLIEVGSAVALLVPALAVFGASALVPTMVGAVLTELF